VGGWAGYFFAKGYLYFRGVVPFDVILNLAFVVFLILPNPEVLKRSRLAIVARSVMSVVIAALLAWHDSWFPPLPDVVRFVADGGLPTGNFVVEFLTGILNPWMVSALVALIAVTAVAGRYIRLSPLVAVLLLIIGLQQMTKPKEAMDQVVASFLSEESKRVVRFPAAGEQSPVFDVVFLHVCSLSWDDLREVGETNPDIFRKFDYLLTNFNSVTAHSTNAVLRLLRSTCGQTAQEALYRNAKHECYLLDALRASGYGTWFAMNHTGEYMGLKDYVQEWGHSGTPIGIDDLPIRQYDFDGGPLRADDAVLERWLRLREQSGVQRAALYYNTTTLHIGGRRVGDTGESRANREQYPESLETMFSDLDRFFSLLVSSARNTVVVFVPEHGAALRGTKFQPSGLREIPLASITTVPVGIKLIGPDWFRGGHPDQQIIDRPTSYLAVTTLLAEFADRPTLALNEDDVRRMVERIPSTDFVAENEGAIVVQDNGRYFMKRHSRGSEWTELPSEVLAGEPNTQQGKL